MSLNVGELVGYLRLDMGDFETGMAKGQALADKLDGKNVDVKVDADTGVAEAKLAGVAASEAKVDEGNKHIAQSGQDAGRGMGALVAAVLLLGPALVPIAAGAAGLAVGFGAMGAAGVLAIVGIVQEMKAGTPLGLQYTAMLSTLKGDLTTLGHTAASGVLGPFQKEVATLQGQMPQLNSIVGEFSVITGKTAGVLTTGLVAAFIALEPLARDAGVYILGLSQRFAAMMSGPGVVSFGDYVRSVFPQVMQAVESVVTAAVRLVAALAPLGLGTLSILRTFSDLINALPVDVLATLATTAASVYIGFSAFRMLQVPLASVGTALQFVGVSAEGAATGVRTLTIAAGVIGAVITVATLLVTAHSESVRKDQAAVNSLTDALRASNGAINDSIRLQVEQKLAADGLVDAAVKAGVSVSDLTSAYLGNAPAMARFNAAIDVAQHGTQSATDTTVKFGEALNGTNGIWDQAAAAKSKDTLVTGDAAVKLKELWTTVNGGPAVLKASETALKNETAAKATGTVATTAATQAMLDSATAHLSATGATKAEMTAINLLNTAMDAEISRALSLSGATSGVDQAVLNMNTALKANKGTLNQHTQAGISDRQAIEAVASSLQSQRDAQIKAGASTADATGKYQRASAALLVQTGKLDGTKSAAYKYLQQLLAIPPSVKTTISANTAQAVAAVSSLQGYLNRLHSKNIVLTVTQQNSANKLLGMGHWRAYRPRRRWRSARRARDVHVRLHHRGRRVRHTDRAGVQG